MLSLLTNAAAMTALQNLSQTNRNLEVTQNRISTGLRVGSASDNAAYWSIATTMDSDKGALATVKDALNLGSANIDVATAGLNAALELSNEIKNKLVAATQPGIDRTKVQDEITALQDQLRSVADSAVFSGQNWLSVDSSAASYNAIRAVVASYSRDNTGAITINTIDIDISTKSLYDVNGNLGIIDQDRTVGGSTISVAAIDISALTDSAADITTINEYVEIADAALTDIVSASSSLGASKARVKTQQQFVKDLTDSITRGIGALVDADMTEESTRLQALQVQQQLGVQSLSIANQNSQTILSLFRG
ncbi:MAG: flagellin [Methylobacteriaceae bacterium]|nr:flagellin [Methylobacteriaceae bacterium]